MTESSANATRKGLINSVVGKAKQLAGAALNNESLTQEGQLQQAAGKTRRAASADEAVADARAQEASETLAREQENARQERQRAAARAGEEQRSAETIRHEQHAAAEKQARSQAATGRSVVERRTASEIDRATAEAQREQEEAEQKLARAAEQRRQQQRIARADETEADRARAQAAHLDPNQGEETNR